MAEKPIKLGFVSGLTGVLEGMAKNQLKGVTLAVEEINKKGGVIGRQVEIVSRDDASDPRLTTKHNRELIYREKVDFLVGQLSAATHLAANKEAKKAKKIFVSLGQTNELTMAPNLSPYTFHQCVTIYMIVQAVSKWTFENLGKRWFILTTDYEWGWQALEGYQSFAKRMGAKIIGVIKVPFPAKEKDAFTKHFPQILRKKPEVLIVGNNGLDQLKFINDASRAGLKSKMSIVNTLSEMRVAGAIDPVDAVGMYWGSSFYWKLENILPITKKFVSAYKKRFGRLPSSYSAYGYSGAIEALTAINKAGKYPIDPDKVARELEGRAFAHYKNPEWWRPCDHQAFQDCYVLKFKGPEERKSKNDTSEIIDTVPWDLDMERTCGALGHGRKMWGHVK